MDVHGQDRSEVSLGELLKVQVKLSDEDTYGVFIRNLIAKDEFGFNNLTLIDKSGKFFGFFCSSTFLRFFAFSN